MFTPASALQSRGHGIKARALSCEGMTVPLVQCRMTCYSVLKREFPQVLPRANTRRTIRYRQKGQEFTVRPCQAVWTTRLPESSAARNKIRQGARPHGRASILHTTELRLPGRGLARWARS